MLAIDKTAQKLSNKLKSFATQKYTATLRLIDRVTEPASKVNALLKKIAGGAYRVTLKLADGALSGIRKIETSLMRITSKAYNIAVNVRGAAGKKLDGLLSGAALGAGVFMPMAGVAGVGFSAASAVSASADFEKQMSKVQAIRQLDKNSDEMNRLREQAKNLGMTTAWTRKQVGEAQYYQALAGWSTENILKTTPHLLNLASAADLDLGRTSDIVTDTMTAFNLKPTDTYRNAQGHEVGAAEHYIDLLAKLQAVSNTDVSTAYEALKYSANQFGALSMNLQGQDRVQAAMENATDAAVMTGLLANAGIKGSMAGTGMSNILQRMVSGNRNVFYGLGLTDTQVEDFQHNLLPMEKIIKQLNKSFHEGMDVNKLADFMEELEGVKIHADTRRKLDKLSKDILENGGKMGSADAAQLAMMFGGAEHAHKLLALIMGDWDAMEQKLTNVEGTADRMAKTMTDNLAGSFIMLQSAWDAFSQDLFTTTAGDGLRNFVDALTEMITRAGKLFKDGIDFGDIFSIIGDAIGRLKSKFLELDGIGSLLAGGALATGLMKIAKLAQNVTTSLKTIGKPPTSSGVSAAQKVGTMNVTAGVVNVNGKISGGSAGRKVGNQAIIDNYYRTREEFNARQARWANAGSAAAGAAAFAGIFGVLDILNTKSFNAERLANATPETRAQILRENRQAEAEVVGATAGGVFGAAAGAALGSALGPVGTMFGGMVGGMIGQILGVKAAEISNSLDKTRDGINETLMDEKIKNHLNPPKPDYSFGQTQKTFDDYSKLDLTWKGVQSSKTEAQVEVEDFRAKLDAETAAWKQQMLSQTWSEQFQSQFLPTMTPDIYKANQTYNPEEILFNRTHAAELNAEQMAQQAAMEAGAFTQEPIELPKPDTESYFADLHSEFEAGFAQIPEIATTNLEGVSTAFETSFAQLPEIATSKTEEVTNAFTTSKEQSQAAWSEMPGFFSGIFGGLGGAAEAAGSAIYSGLTSVIGSIIGAWESAASTINGIISRISAAGSSVGATVSGVIAQVRGHAEGGFITRPELAMVGEAGPELILPLTDKERSRELLSQASGVLGDGEERPHELVSQASVLGTVEERPSESKSVTVNASFNMTVNNLEEAGTQAEEKLRELADKVAGIFASTLSDAHANQALT